MEPSLRSTGLSYLLHPFWPPFCYSIIFLKCCFCNWHCCWATVYWPRWWQGGFVVEIFYEGGASVSGIRYHCKHLPFFILLLYIFSWSQCLLWKSTHEYQTALQIKLLMICLMVINVFRKTCRVTTLVIRWNLKLFSRINDGMVWGLKSQVIVITVCFLHLMTDFIPEEQIYDNSGVVTHACSTAYSAITSFNR